MSKSPAKTNSWITALRSRVSTRGGWPIRLVAAIAAAGAIASGTFFAGAGSALAPEPAKLTVKIDGTTGATGAAVYVNSATPTKVLFYNSSWVAAAIGPAAGTPCSSTGLPVDAITSHVIQTLATSSTVYRRCL